MNLLAKYMMNSRGELDDFVKEINAVISVCLAVDVYVGKFLNVIFTDIIY